MDAPDTNGKMEELSHKEESPCTDAEVDRRRKDTFRSLCLTMRAGAIANGTCRV